MKKEYYLKLRKKYKPEKLNIVFILESPPVSGKYFYKEEDSIKEPLFAAMMKLIGFKPDNKREGLIYFAKSGFLIVDAIYEPVNQLKGKKRDDTILKNYTDLVADLNGLEDSKKISIILVKANICRLFEKRLVQDGFNVQNHGIKIPFPSTGHQNKFQSEVRKVMSKAVI